MKLLQLFGTAVAVAFVSAQSGDPQAPLQPDAGVNPNPNAVLLEAAVIKDPTKPTPTGTPVTSCPPDITTCREDILDETTQYIQTIYETKTNNFTASKTILKPNVIWNVTVSTRSVSKEGFCRVPHVDVKPIIVRIPVEVNVTTTQVYVSYTDVISSTVLWVNATSTDACTQEKPAPGPTPPSTPEPSAAPNNTYTIQGKNAAPPADEDSHASIVAGNDPAKSDEESGDDIHAEGGIEGESD